MCCHHYSDRSAPGLGPGLRLSTQSLRVPGRRVWGFGGVNAVNFFSAHLLDKEAKSDGAGGGGGEEWLFI